IDSIMAARRNIAPHHYEGNIPVFQPTLAQFESFNDFVQNIDKYGMESGVVKVIPPDEWKQSLPPLDDRIDSIHINRPIEQHIHGTNGMYRQQNIEKSRNYTLEQWRRTCETLDHQPPAKRGEKRKQIKHDAAEQFDYRFDDSVFTDEYCQDLERTYWKSLTYNAPLYGADMPGSLFDDSVKSWNVAHLDNILDLMDEDLPGVNTAYLYCGMWKSTFAWHLEDMDLYSINYIHFGAPKQWYSIPQADHKKFYDLMKSIWPQEYKHCREFLRHKTFLVSPSIIESHNIRVNKIVHRAGEFMLTYPYGYHAGFNYGYNVAESVNFALESWLDIGLISQKCTCISDSVGINVPRLQRRVNGIESEDEDENSHDDGASALLTPPDSEEGGNSVTTARPKKKTKTAKPTKIPNPCALCPSHIRLETLPVNSKVNVHRGCAQVVPEVTISKDAGSREFVAGFQAIPKLRFSLKCLGCHEKQTGACLQCNDERCNRAYHPTCAIEAGARL
ncbi:hypothetical protein CANCADRAFT_18236, partial [Tortispora caseinolytica NRRL Y-17796]